MFKIPIENIKKVLNLDKRKASRIIEWIWRKCRGLNFYGAIKMGLKEEELQPIVTAWRNANPNITKFWWDVDKAAKKL